MQLGVSRLGTSSRMQGTEGNGRAGKAEGSLWFAPLRRKPNLHPGGCLLCRRRKWRGAPGNVRLERRHGGQAGAAAVALQAGLLRCLGLGQRVAQAARLAQLCQRPCGIQEERGVGEGVPAWQGRRCGNRGRAGYARAAWPWRAARTSGRTEGRQGDGLPGRLLQAARRRRWCSMHSMQQPAPEGADRWRRTRPAPHQCFLCFRQAESKSCGQHGKRTSSDRSWGGRSEAVPAAALPTSACPPAHPTSSRPA